MVGLSYENCQKKIFHRFVYKCVCDIKFINVTNIKEVNLQVSLGYTEFVSEYDGFNVKIENLKINGFIFGQVLKLTMKFYSNLSNISIDYYLKLHIPIWHRKFVKIIYENPQYVKRFCNDRTNPFHFAIREWTNCL